MVARPIKDGVDYFPLDVSLDEKFQLIEAEFGLDGFAVVVKLYQRIYGGRGYYCEWNDEVALLFSRQCALGGKVVSEIVTASIRRGIFDATLYQEQGILTSSGIQKRYLEATDRRKVVNIRSDYLLVPADTLSDNVVINQVNVNNNPQNANNNPQTRLDKIREKESNNKGAALLCDLAPAVQEAMGEYIKARKKLRKPMTDRAIALATRKLKELAGDDSESQVAHIELAIERGWLSFYPIKENSYGGGMNDATRPNGVNQGGPGHRSAKYGEFDGLVQRL